MEQTQITYSHSIPELFNFLHKPRFGIEGYLPEKKYDDHIKKPDIVYGVVEQPKKKPLKRGSYLNDIESYIKRFPKPKLYDVSFKWPDPKEKQKRIASKGHRYSFIDNIFNQKNKTPGPNAYDCYNAEQTKKEDIQKNKTIGKDLKINHNQDDQAIAQSIPGPGTYNPHIEVQHLKKQMEYENPKSMKQKHQEKLRRITQNLQKTPGMQKYRPHNIYNKQVILFIKAKIKNIGEKKLSIQAIKFQLKIRFQVLDFIILRLIGKFLKFIKGKDILMNKTLNKTSSYLDIISKGIQKSIYYQK